MNNNLEERKRKELITIVGRKIAKQFMWSIFLQASILYLIISIIFESTYDHPIYQIMLFTSMAWLAVTWLISMAKTLEMQQYIDEDKWTLISLFFPVIIYSVFCFLTWKKARGQSYSFYQEDLSINSSLDYEAQKIELDYDLDAGIISQKEYKIKNNLLEQKQKKRIGKF